MTARGVPQRYFEEVVLTYESDECLIWPFTVGNGGYGLMFTGDDVIKKRVTRLLCERIYGPPPTPKHVAAHKPGCHNPRCCNKRHVRWATQKENQEDRVADGTSNRGQRCGKVRLTEAQVLEIRSTRGNDTIRNTAKRFGVASGTITAIHSGKSWGWLNAQ